MQNSSKEFTGKHGSTVIPPHLPAPTFTIPGFPRLAAGKQPAFREDHHTVALGRVLGAWALEKMPKGKGLPCLAPETAILRDTSKVWEVPSASAPCLPRFSPFSPGSFPANPFCRSTLPGSKFREKLTPQLLGPCQPLFPTPDSECKHVLPSLPAIMLRIRVKIQKNLLKINSEAAICLPFHGNPFAAWEK